VLLAAEMMGERDDLLPDLKDAFAMIRRNVALEARFVDDLLDVTRIARGKLELARVPIAVHDAVLRAVEVTHGDFDAKHQRLAVDLAARNDRVSGDLVRLQQVVWNLLKNAAKFTPTGGEVSVRTRNEGEAIVIDVADNGIGLEPDQLGTIFDPFVQADPTIARTYGGLGLGLAIAQATVRGHDGELTVHSEGRGRGARFTVRLPLAAAPAKEAP
jgi:signal transduction histidine kinase